MTLLTARVLRAAEGLGVAWLALSLLATRLFIHAGLGIRPNLAPLLEHWQHLDLAQLHERLVPSLLGLHSQPPLWNLVIGTAATVCQAGELCTLRWLHAFNIALTFAAAVMLLRSLRWLGLTQAAALVAAIAFTLLPSTVYYENYTFYPHLAMVLVLAVFTAVLAHQRSRALHHLALALLAVALLSWLWGLFHPLIMAGVGALMVLRSPASPSRAKGVMMLTLVLVVLLPSAKNLALHGFFGTSSWLGMNMSQVAPERPPRCRFQDFRPLVPVAHNGTAFNDPSIIPYADACLEAALAAIRADPLAYLWGRAMAAVSSLRRTSSDYFFPPVGFDAYPRIVGGNPLRTPSGALNPRILHDLVILLTNLLLIANALAFAWRPQGAGVGAQRAFAVAALLIATVLLVGHAFNGGEQERMRYTLAGVLYLGLLLRLRVWFAGRLRSPLQAGLDR